MRFEYSALKNFRNLKDTQVRWGPRLNLILGPNGAGKTNLLEALNILAGWGPFGRTRSVVSWASPEGRALLGARTSEEPEGPKPEKEKETKEKKGNEKQETETGTRTHELRVLVSSRMTPRLDGKRVTCTDLRLVVPSLTFLPTDINLIDGSPSVRRLFIDRLCALYSPPYARRLAEFRQVSRHRAALLRQGKPVRGTTLPFAQLGGWLMEVRRYVASLLFRLADTKDTNKTGETERTPFLSFFFPASNVPGMSGMSNANGSFSFSFSFAMWPALKENESGADYLLSALDETAEQERQAMRPLAGPGHDDLEIFFMGRPAAESLSRGQKRRLVLSLMLTAGRLIERRLKKKPVLLFDDLAAELDADGRAAACTALLETGWQVFVTGTEDPFPDLNFNNLKNICVLPL